MHTEKNKSPKSGKPFNLPGKWLRKFNNRYLKLGKFELGVRQIFFKAGIIKPLEQLLGI